MKDIIIPALLEGKEAEPSKENKKIELIWSGKTLRSLQDIRDNFEPEELLKVHMKGDLSLWLSQHYYETEAEAVSNITIEDKHCLFKLCQALNIPYTSASGTEELEEKKTKLRAMNLDEKIINEAHLVAFDQEEMAELLNRGADIIYLCKGSFSIPLGVPNIHYVVIGGAVIENAKVEWSYKEKGITVEGYDLPQSKNTVEQTATDPIASGAMNHSPLTRAYHAAWDCLCDIYVKPFSFTMKNAIKKYSSRRECEKAMEQCIQKAYHEAEKYLNTEYSTCAAKTARDYYSERIQYCADATLSSLETLSRVLGKNEAFNKLSSLANKSRKKLYEQLEKILYDNASYYSMPDIGYYLNLVEVEQEDNRFSEDGVFRFIEGIVTDSIQYHAPDLFSVTEEISNDARKLLKEYNRDAKRVYDDYISNMEALLDEIGAGLPEFEEDEGIKDYIERICIGSAAGKYKAA